MNTLESTIKSSERRNSKIIKLLTSLIKYIVNNYLLNGSRQDKLAHGESNFYFHVQHCCAISITVLTTELKDISRDDLV